MKHGNAKDVAKYLERVSQDLGKGRDLARIGIDDAYAKQCKELADAIRAVRNLPATAQEHILAKYDTQLRAVIGRAELEANALIRMKDAGYAEKRVLENLLRNADDGMVAGLKDWAARNGVSFGDALFKSVNIAMLAYDLIEAGYSDDKSNRAAALAQASFSTAQFMQARPL